MEAIVEHPNEDAKGKRDPAGKHEREANGADKTDDGVWDRTQDSSEHERWDLRFLTIEYVPRVIGATRASQQLVVECGQKLISPNVFT